jgi:NADPH-dependent curcumin reductase CurA
MATYNTVVLAKRPTGDIKVGETFKLKPEKRVEESDLKDGQVLVETWYLSLDPAMRSWLNGKFFLAPRYSTGHETLLRTFSYAPMELDEMA